MSARTAEVICAEINAHTKKAENHLDTRAALVRELRENHPDSWLPELKARCQIGRSQAFKIAAIADGRTTEEEEREKEAERQRKHRERVRDVTDDAQALTPEEEAVQTRALAKWDAGAPRRWRNSFFSFVEDAEAARKLFSLAFGERWKEFEVTHDLVEAADRVVAEWTGLAAFLRARIKH
jgi:hypothetical protein